MERIGERIRLARKAAGLTQQELANLAGTTYGMIGQWENGHRTPKRASIVKLADALGLAAEKLEYGNTDQDNFDAFPREFLEWLDRLGYEIKIVPKSNTNT